MDHSGPGMVEILQQDSHPRKENRPYNCWKLGSSTHSAPPSRTSTQPQMQQGLSAVAGQPQVAWTEKG